MAVTLPPGPAAPLSWQSQPGKGLRSSRGIGRVLRILLAVALSLWFILPLVPLGL
ncbi:MAG: hypothetical protein M3017_04070 [Actinomycetota bacterium]|nr:hypothetical protein [Actinomycetota bacterium]